MVLDAFGQFQKLRGARAASRTLGGMAGRRPSARETCTRQSKPPFSRAAGAGASRLVAGQLIRVGLRQGIGQ